MNDNLPELRDIHLPDGVSPWPPAYGWFVLLLGIAAAFLLVRLYRLWRQKSRKVYALHLLSELNDNQPVAAAVSISELLRRICVYRYPEAVSLSGENWLSFLRTRCHEKLSDKAAELLLNAPYVNPAKEQYQTEDLQQLKAFARRWVGENL